MFEIKANNLLRESEIKTLKLQSKDFDITFFYYGDYAKDMEKNGSCDLANISMHCKSIDRTLELEYARGYIFVSINGYTMLTIDQVERFKKKLDDAHAAAIELQGILNQYFGLGE